jgi:DNA-binding helix-hairpin-helix protein with protein kinase domain
MVLEADTEVDLGVLGQARVSRVIGQGGQGHVYEVRRSNGAALALKWYKPQVATHQQYQEIQTLVDFGPPHKRFLWPLSIATIRTEPGFGYVMPLREDTFVELGFLLSGHDKDGNPLDVSFTSIISMCRQLSMSYLRLHARGLCYRDISFGNVFFNPESGDVLICDNDNVGIDNGQGRVLGTPFFMAPEVVRDTTFHTLPNTDTDRHSLAVLLFYILFVGHPLEGRRTERGLRDAGWLMRHFGTDPLFCMHPDDDSNRPTSDVVEQYWRLYPTFLRELFIRAFVDALHEPTHRVTEGEWIRAADRLRDSMVVCGSCQATNFWDRAEPNRECFHCGGLLRPPFLLRIGRREIAVSVFASIRADHVRSGADDPTILGQLRQHPQDPSRWGITNLSSSPWRATYANGQEYRTDPNDTIELAAGLRIDIDRALVTVTLP